MLRSKITEEKASEIRVGDSLVNRLLAIEAELNALEFDLFKEPADWDVIAIYPKYVFIILET